ncbi:MAG TPA: glutamine-hydrolyzing GMP synthase [Desulfatiglandales bacterium]|nr:glutamine-hydrolyzing GMP synthase [Desulfatiglandales bacterium]
MILIIDFGSQYNQLIARRVREKHAYCEIEPPDIALSRIKSMSPQGIILSGGPASIYEKNSPKIDPQVFDLNIPILGICYGMQYMIDCLGGKVERAAKREYGLATLNISDSTGIFNGINKMTPCWMSHGDSISSLPEDFKATASTENTPIAAAENDKDRFYGLQFHPEVTHTPEGSQMLENFLSRICGCKKTWTMKLFVKKAVEDIKEEVKDKKVILALSGGVDSSVAAVLLNKALGKQLTCIFVDNGLLRKGEVERVKGLIKRNFNIALKTVNARKRFLDLLKDIENPERKRKIIGKTFIRIFEEEALKIKGVEYLAQGTLYPDLIESRSAFGGPSAVIKSHHNVGGLPKKMRLKLIEPLKHLFKDEVRLLGKELGLPDEMIYRHPFPGPGLAVRIIGAVTPRRLSVLRHADDILITEIKKNNQYNKLWQSFAILLPLKTVGVMGDKRTYEHILGIRAVTSHDAMTADWARLSHSLLAGISNRIINEVRGVNRVVYDISSKPPSTIEWE